jgi:sulfate transport system ATP-binding protein
VMSQGKIEQVGSPREVYDAPATEFVMGFIGPVSRLDGRLVRPHDVSVTTEPRDGAIEAMVRRVLHLGFEVRVELQVGDGSATRVQLTRETAEELELAEGDIVYVRPRAGADLHPTGEPLPPVPETA